MAAQGLAPWAARGLETSSVQAVGYQASWERAKLSKLRGGWGSLVVLRHLSVGLARYERAPPEKERVMQSYVLSIKMRFQGIISSVLSYSHQCLS